MLTPKTDPWLPGWATRAVFYHIYPIGFFDAPPDNPGGDPVPRLAELRRWYDHLAGLGVNALYIGPVFESISHGYDTTDYFRLDRRLGDNELLRTIVQELHDRKIKVIFDGVFNHTGREFFAFQDIRQNGPNSAYVNWYVIDWNSDSQFGDGFSYECWNGHQILPRLNLDNPDTRKYIFEVSRMWLGDYGLDGWRLDVAADIAPSFWWEFRRECKAANPDCLLVGEVWGGDYRALVAPDLLDTCTNYQLYYGLDKAFNEGDLSLLRAIMDRAADPEIGIYKDLNLANFLGNHDVTRILSLLEDANDIFPALILLMTIPGIPFMYYGDEVGMMAHKSDGDPALRRPMLAPDAVWPDRDHRIYSAIAQLTGIRRDHASLQHGSLISLDAGQGYYAYLRRHVRENAVVVLNSADTPVSLSLSLAEHGIPDGTVFYDRLDPHSGPFTVSGGGLEVPDVHPGWGRLLIAGA